MKTRILKVPSQGDGGLGFWSPDKPALATWSLPPNPPEPLREAALALQQTSTPVAFPTETVYGLGADATRSPAVRGIYAAKGRPSDNPLIIHVSDLDMLSRFLPPGGEESRIPEIYREVIHKFWPGPLTILLPVPLQQTAREEGEGGAEKEKEEAEGGEAGEAGEEAGEEATTTTRKKEKNKGVVLAPEVTAGLSTFGVRMPASPLARTLIKLVGNPLAAPSANASTRPSPTKAQHVLEDLDGRIDLILDGGDCRVGVESTVVDGLCDPPVVLRPGGVGIEELRRCRGWEGVVKGYKDRSEVGGQSAPRAPGMKYKHYSPKARVVLFEKGGGGGGGGGQEQNVGERDVIGVLEGGKTKTVAFIRTGRWGVACGLRNSSVKEEEEKEDGEGKGRSEEEQADGAFAVKRGVLLGEGGEQIAKLLDVDLGQDVEGVAHGLFAALRELDRQGADVIFVEGVSDGDDIAGAVMNRLRKAASEIRQ